MLDKLNTSQQQSIIIADHGEVRELNYSELVKYHSGDSIWGFSVAFRALQLASLLFSEKQPWVRKNIFIVSSHPGPGVRDAIEFVTHCVSQNRFRLADEVSNLANCSSSMRYKWKISYEMHSTDISLREDFVPNEFYELLDRLNSGEEKHEDKKLFKQFKNTFVEDIWCEPITSNYLINNNEINDYINL